MKESSMNHTIRILRGAVDWLEHDYRRADGVLLLYKMPTPVYQARAHVLGAIRRLEAERKEDPENM